MSADAECVTLRYVRLPERDRRFKYGDDYAGDAWIDRRTGEIRWTAVGVDLNEQPFVPSIYNGC